MKKNENQHAVNKIKALLQNWYVSNRLLLVAALLSLIAYSFSKLPLAGINQPTPVAPYLNGVFPPSSPGGSQGSWEVENAFPQLTFPDPMNLLEVPGMNTYYVVSKTGRIWQIEDSSTAAAKDLVLDISTRTDTDEDSGLINAILHPEFGQAGSENRGYLYVFYRWHPDGNIADCATGAFLRLSRFTRPDGEQNFDPDSELVLIQTYDDHCWHMGGGMFFDQEGLFYLALGDAGGVNDQYGVTQQITGRFFSGLLRIDLDRDPARSHPIRRQQVDPPSMPFSSHSSFAQGYYIPNDNPWQDENGGVLEEFYAIGLRNPHRVSLDEATGKIWVADVGQGRREEISIAAKGANLQWPFREGFIEANASPPDPFIGLSTPPIYDYDHAMGNSIIGGMVYRGDFYQGALNGQYIFGDHGVRNVWAYNPVNGEVVFLVNLPDWGDGEKKGISSFAVNSAGEIFVLKLYGTNQDGGVIYRLKQASNVPEPPALLSQTGAFADLVALEPGPGLLPYRVNAPLWSDGAEKQRWIALPNDGKHDAAEEQITFSENGNWQFPAGTVFVKHFELPVDANQPGLTKRVETRFFVITEDGGGYGLTYKWNDAGTDAELLINSTTKDFTITEADGSQRTQSWEYPSRTDCTTCHNGNSDFVLGVHTWQLNGDLEYPDGLTDNQLNTWRHLGMFANSFSPSDIGGFPKAAGLADGSASLVTRVRSYLDANCAHCHRPNGVEGAFDARFSTPLEAQNLIWTYGISRNTDDDHYIVKPLDTSESELWLRDGSLGEEKMPPLAKKLVDETYMAVLTEWINSLEEEACVPVPLTDLSWQNAANGVGPIEVDSSNGESQPGDGRTISINGQTFERGLGVHADSEISYRTNGDYEQFQAYVGIDDEVIGCNSASMYFEVYADDVLVYQSALLRPGQGPEHIKADIQGTDVVKLVAQGGEDGNSCDHGDWGNPLFLPCGDCELGAACNDGDPCTVNDQYNADCACVGTFADADGDGICDAEDQCPGADDLVDVDQDGIPDACDNCLEIPGTPCDDGDACTENDQYDADCHCRGTFADEDGDGVCNAEDQCPGVDDRIDVDQDGIPDGCDDCLEVAGNPCDDGDPCTVGDQYDSDCHCAGIFADTDGDGICDAQDQCPDADDKIDEDQDGIPDGCDDCLKLPGTPCDDGDVCTTLDQYQADCECRGIYFDSDFDGVCDAEDQCQGFDDRKDRNGNGIPDDCEFTQLTPGPRLGAYYDSGLDELIVAVRRASAGRAGIFIRNLQGMLIRELMPTGALPSGEQVHRFYPELSPGVYYLELAGASASTYARFVVPGNSDQAQRSKTLSVSVRPNPFHQDLRIHIQTPIPEMKRATIRIFDKSGRTLYVRYDAPFGEEMAVPIHQGWVAGTYLLSVHASEYTYVQQIVKQ